MEANTFTLLAKTSRSKLPKGFRPIASIRVMYKISAHMILARIEDLLDQAQPEEQHGFRGGYKLEEHVITFAVLLEKTIADGTAVAH